MKKAMIRKYLSLPLILILFVISLSFANVSGALAQDSGLFFPYETYPTGSWPEAVAIGDVNGDGRNDVVMTTSYYFDPANDFKIHVFLQNASGELGPPIKYWGTNGGSIDIGDINNDGKADIVVTVSNGIGVLLQNNSGGLDSLIMYASNHTSQSNSYKVRIGDFNNDGRFDVVSIDWGSQSHDVDVYLQSSDGTLNAPVSYTVEHSGYDDLEVGDVNNDGLTDIVVMSGQTYSIPNIGILFQNPAGIFDVPVYYDPVETNSHGLAIGDVNSDHLQDVLVTYGGNKPNSGIALMLQNSLGYLNPAITYLSYDCPEPIEIADLNNDGRSDVIVVHGGWLAMGVYLQGNDGTLLPYELYPIPYASHYNPHGLAIGDINGDRALDMAIADYNHGLVVLYHKPIVGDSDSDGYEFADDCNDLDPAIYPGAPEVKGDGVDQNCDGYDLTIAITKANYKKNDELRVEATSFFGDAADLELSVYGSMKWKHNQQRWEITIKPAGGDPGIVTVCGMEGCESVNTKVIEN